MLGRPGPVLIESGPGLHLYTGDHKEDLMYQRRKKKINANIFSSLALFIAIMLVTNGCMRYLTHNRNEVLLEGIDINQTLEIAELELQKDKLGASLTLWAIRDQVINPIQAGIISRLYLENIDNLKKFDTWHLTWAIANIYRHGNRGLKQVMASVYQDATRRAQDLHKLADRMANRGKIYMGDAHAGGRRFAQRHVVVPGNQKYLQSVDEYRQRNLK